MVHTARPTGIETGGARGVRVAITREISPELARCELEHLERRTIDIALARAQHRAYEACLADLGCTVRRVPAEPSLPDGVFVEDAAVVFDELAVITRPGAVTRRGETRTVSEVLAAYRELVHLVPPARLDGGDVLRIGRTVLVGRSSRTDAEGVRQLSLALTPHGYRIREVAVTRCLHLKSAVTRVGERACLVQPAWIDPGALEDLEKIEVAPDEPFAANVLLVGGTVVAPAAFPRTRTRLERLGIAVRAIDVSEIAKAEGGLTCCSLVFSCRDAGSADT